MNFSLIEYEAILRVFLFVFAIATFSILEFAFPKMSYVNQRSQRWIVNYGLVIFNTLALRIAFPLLAVQLAASWNWGLFHHFSMPFGFELILSLLILDVIIYFQHRIFHAVPLLWRLHRIHHMDQQIDSSTALRFHPLEITLSMLVKMLTIIAIGLSAEAVLLFEIGLNFLAIFNHSNWNLGRWDQKVKALLVTPDMHRIHHSVEADETNSNYGFCLSAWDRIFGSYNHAAKKSWANFEIGLNGYQNSQSQNFWHLLISPFRKS